MPALTRSGAVRRAQRWTLALQMYQTPPPGYPAAPAGGPCGQNPSPNGAAEKRVLYIGNLAPDCTEQMLVAVFAQFGQCLACKIIRSGGGPDSYAFMEFPTHQQAQIALTAMNHISLMGRELRVNWATAPGTKPDPTKGHHVFVGDLLPDIEESEIMDTFVPFGPIIDCKVVRHTDGGFKTYAFLTYENEEDAKSAIATLNGTLLRHKPMRVSQASRRFGGGDGSRNRRAPKRTYEEVYNETSLYNTSVYVGGIVRGISESLLREHFKDFGNILDIKIYEEKGYGFVRFDSHEDATRAIVAMQGAQVGEYSAKLGWGKDGASQPPPKAAKGPESGDPRIGPSGPAPAADDPAYQKYYQDYMEWYKKYGEAYYQQYYQQYGQYPTSMPPPPAAAAGGNGGDLATSE